MTDAGADAESSIVSHRLRRMVGRDPAQSGRAATPLELLFDLTFVVAFGQAADQMSRLVAADHILPAVGGFVFAMVAICWAWVNFSWFASAYDTDDWFFRAATMVQMVGVLVLALGLPAMFASLDQGPVFNNGVMVAGYVIMRIAMVAQWLRAARQDAPRRRSALVYAITIFTAQVGWVALFLLRTSPLPVIVVIALVDVALEILAPVLAERKDGGTPWNAHHIAERYGLLAIIALGEGVVGTVAPVSAIVQRSGWSSEAILIVVAGTGLTFGMWWIYFTIPSGAVLEKHRGRAFAWGYLHILIFASITATGAGLQVAAFVIEGDARIGAQGSVLAVSVPVLVYIVTLFGIYSYLLHSVDLFHGLLFAVTVALLALADILAGAGVSMGVCLLITMLAPFAIVIGFETIGHRHAAAALSRTLSD